MSARLPSGQDLVLALPINGESFLLRRAGRHILIDGGYKKDRIAQVLETHVNEVRHLDIVVCTHGDRDHVGGLPGLLGDWSDRVGELWLPGRWVNVIPDLARDPNGFYNELVKELDAELTAPSEQFLSVMRHAHEAHEREEGNRSETWEATPQFEGNSQDSPDEWLDGSDNVAAAPQNVPREPEWFEALRSEEEKLATDEIASRAAKSARRKVKYRQSKKVSCFDARAANYWLGLIETSEAIRKVAIAAIRYKIRTRWFDFEEFSRTRKPAGGDPDFLIPINAVEQAPPPTFLLRCMHLTQINRESLVFYSPPNLNWGALFCADSPLGDGRNFSRSFLPTHLGFPLSLSWTPIVATAPHHGSESNKAAYDHLNAMGVVVVLLRAGGSRKQPGPTFLNQKDLVRVCAKCPRAGYGPMLSGVVGCLPYTYPSIPYVFGRPCNCS